MYFMSLHFQEDDKSNVEAEKNNEIFIEEPGNVTENYSEVRIYGSSSVLISGHFPSSFNSYLHFMNHLF